IRAQILRFAVVQKPSQRLLTAGTGIDVDIERLALPLAQLLAEETLELRGRQAGDHADLPGEGGGLSSSRRISWRSFFCTRLFAMSTALVLMPSSWATTGPGRLSTARASKIFQSRGVTCSCTRARASAKTSRSNVFARCWNRSSRASSP